VGASDVIGFDWAVFDRVVTHHFEKLSVSGVACRGLGLWCSSGILNFTFGEAFILLANNLDHSHSIRGLHVNVGESTAHAVLFSVEGDLLALEGHEDPISSSVVANCEAICLQLGQGE
jgi:hypothetical protein